MDFSSKIRLAREKTGLSRRAFGELLGVPEAKIQKIEIGQQRADHEFLIALAQNSPIDLDWLLRDGPQPSGFADQPQSALASPQPLVDCVTLPLIQAETAANQQPAATDEANDGAHYAFSRHWLTRHNLTPDTLAVVQVTGDSMEPKLSEGDLAVIDTSDTELCDGVTYVVSLGHDLLVKHLQILPQSHVKLCSHNSDFEPILVDLKNNDLTCVGRVVASLHKR